MKAILLIALGALVLEAQTGTKARKPANPPPKTRLFPLQEVQVKGNKLLTAAQIVAVAALPLKAAVQKSDFEAARDRLLATGYFESVAFRYWEVSDATGKSFGLFDVVEVPSVYPVQFENLPVPAAEIETELKAHNAFYGPKIPGTQQVLGYYARQIEQFLAARNKPERVVGELSPDGKDNFHVLFHSGEPLPSVAFVTFTGNKAISTVTLQNAMNDVAFGSTFSRDHIRQLLDHQIRPLYDAKGLIRVAFPMFTTEPAPKVKGVTVHVTVEEGPVYNTGKVTLTGVDSDYDEYVKIKPGVVANFDEVNAALESVKKQLKRNGYLDAQGEVERKVDDKAHTVDIKIEMKPGPQYTMGTLTITGLDLNTEPVVRKLWNTAEGKPFNASYPDYFLTRIREDGLFDGLGTTKSSTVVHDETHVVDVTLNFGYSPKPKPPKKPGSGGFGVPLQKKAMTSAANMNWDLLFPVS